MTQETPNDDTSPKPVAANDILADAKTWLADIGSSQRLQTHSANCHKWHSTCLVVKLTREIERLRTLATQATPSEGSVHGEGTVGERLVGRLSITQSLLDDNEKLRAEITTLRGDAQVARLRLEAAHGENARLREAIRRLADQDATLSVSEGSVTVTLDATLTDAEREAVETAVRWLEPYPQVAATLRGLLERLK